MFCHLQLVLREWKFVREFYQPYVNIVNRFFLNAFQECVLNTITRTFTVQSHVLCLRNGYKITQAWQKKNFSYFGRQKKKTRDKTNICLCEKSINNIFCFGFFFFFLN